VLAGHKISEGRPEAELELFGIGQLHPSGPPDANLAPVLRPGDEVELGGDRGVPDPPELDF
jgi:hypothetical protein